MKKSILLFMIVLASYSVSAQSLQELQVRWSSVYKKNIDTRYITKEPISKPEGVRVVLGQIDLLTKDFKGISDCLLYQVPGKNTSGTLLVVEKKVGRTCEQMKFRKPFFKQDDIFNLKLEEQSQKLKLFIDQSKVSFYFFNIINESVDSESANYQFKVPGTMVSFTQSTVATPVLSEFDICADVPNDSCSESAENLCHLCSGSKSYLVVASSCKQSVRRYCGEKKCGLPNMPACIRGRVATDYTGPHCITDSPMGFCVKPARVVCLNNELYCR